MKNTRHSIIKHRVFGFMSVAAFSLMSSTALAVDVPSSAEPGVIIRGIEKESRKPLRSEPAITIEQEKEPVGGGSTEKAMTLKSVVLDGSTVYSQSEVDSLVAVYLGQPTSFADLNTIAQLLTRKYRSDGYILSSVIVPPQKINDSVVHMKVIEGRITDVQVVGTYKDKNHLIADMAKKIQVEGASNTREIERYLLLMDDLPGITARSLLRPSAVPGGGELVITIDEDKFEGSVGVDNRGSDFVGPYRGTAVAAFNSLFGIHDRTTLRGIVTSQTDELRFFDITHEEQVGTEGMRLKGRYAQTTTEPGGSLRDLDLKGDSELFDLEMLYPFFRSRAYNINMILGFNALNSETDALGSNIAKDSVRTIRAGWSVDGTDALAGVNQLEITVTKGVALFNPTSDGTGRSRANGVHGAGHANMSFTRIQELGADFSVQTSFSGQYSVDPLLASEEFSVGGGEYGRAYDAGEITGDRGVAGLIELRFGRPLQNDIVKSYQLFTYYDAGKVWNQDIAVGEVANAGLASVGIGARFNVVKDIFASIELDKPLKRDVNSEGNDDPRLFFNLTKRF